MKKCFTLVEILVVVTIIVLLTSIAAVSYSQITKSSRDARRKADIEQVRAALEMYRSNNDKSSYPVAANWSSLSSSLTPTYIKTMPTDPKIADNYHYSGLPSGCDGTTIPCSDYSVSTNLESGEIYSVDPYGSSSVTPVPTATPTP